MWNPLQSEQAMFRFLLQVAAFCGVVIVITVALRAIL
jgi:hypothetical protein